MTSDFMTKQLKKDNPNHDFALHQTLFIRKNSTKGLSRSLSQPGEWGVIRNRSHPYWL